MPHTSIHGTHTPYACIPMPMARIDTHAIPWCSLEALRPTLTLLPRFASSLRASPSALRRSPAWGECSRRRNITTSTSLFPASLCLWRRALLFAVRMSRRRGCFVQFCVLRVSSCYLLRSRHLVSLPTRLCCHRCLSPRGWFWQRVGCVDDGCSVF